MLVQLHWVWFSLQFGTKHSTDLGFTYFIRRMLSEAQLSQQWNMIGFSALYCHLFFLMAFETVEETVYLSGVPVSNVECLCSRAICVGVLWHIWDFVTALVLCSGCSSFFLRCLPLFLRVDFALLSFPRMCCFDRIDSLSFVLNNIQSRNNAEAISSHIKTKVATRFHIWNVIRILCQLNQLGLSFV